MACLSNLAEIRNLPKPSAEGLQRIELTQASLRYGRIVYGWTHEIEQWLPCTNGGANDNDC
ncbi:hypothetical protein [uncultured Agrobacterium sp.]|uniref:hypothetical protein n=1 Tax=uncultured Agrobacterium sp. TaxID=157277 RepID=UPI0025E6812E|nr:hypothetical protein [uncultured Agrobacterium sp.]